MAKLPRGPSQPSLPTPAPPALGRGCLLSPHPCPALVPSPGFRCHWGSVPRGRGPLPRPRTPLKLAGAQALLAMLSKPRRCDAEGPRFWSCPLELPPCARRRGPRRSSLSSFAGAEGPAGPDAPAPGSARWPRCHPRQGHPASPDALRLRLHSRLEAAPRPCRASPV